MAKRIFLNLDLCCGCRSCAAACFYGHNEQSNLGHGEVGAQANLPMHCLHCEEPACAASCPNNAMQKGDDGIVRRSSFMCVGCRSCSVACPFGVIENDLTRHIVPKCDLCTDRLKEGPDAVPRCVAACTSGALTYVEVDDMAKEEHKHLLSARMHSLSISRRR